MRERACNRCNAAVAPEAARCGVCGSSEFRWAGAVRTEEVKARGPDEAKAAAVRPGKHRAT